MNRRLLLISLLVSFGLLAGIIVDRAASKSTNAQPAANYQSDKWEYAVLIRVHWNSDTRIHYARICYFRTSGCLESDIEGPPMSADDDGFTATKKTLAKAVATLGQAGWEMVGDSPFASGDRDPRSLYFKRRLR
jgi:hypothetical protein